MAEAGKGKEIKIGILALVSILALFLGFSFFKGKNIFSREKEFVAYFDNVEGISASSKVAVNGFNIGKVNSVELTADNRFKVSLSVVKDYKVAKGSVLEAVSSDLLSGAKNLSLIPSKSAEEAEDGSVLQGTIASGLLQGITDGVPGVLDNINGLSANADTLMGNLKGVVTDKTANHVEQILVTVELAMKQIQVLAHALAQQSGSVDDLMKNANGAVKNLNQVTNGLATNGKIDKILSNAENATNQLSEAKIQATINNLETTTQKLNTVIAKLNQNDGTLGLLVNDKQLYNNLNSTVGELGTLLEDIKAHPAKYINISILPAKARRN